VQGGGVSELSVDEVLYIAGNAGYRGVVWLPIGNSGDYMKFKNEFGDELWLSVYQPFERFSFREAA
jgi:hypothetical protein